MPLDQVIDIGTLAVSAYDVGAGGRPLLLLHGFTGNKTDFADVVEPLAERGWHVVAPDLRGHGRTGGSPGEVEADYSYASYAADALALADRRGWESFVLLGHSMGGMIAQEIVRVAPERVRGLILMDTSATAVGIDPGVVAVGVQLAREQGLQAIVDILRLVDDPLGTPADRRMCETVPGYAERGELNTLQCSPVMYAAMLQAVTEPQDRTEQVGAITCPTLVVVGEQDEQFTGPTQVLAAAIPGATHAVIADGGHSPQLESPDAWLAAVVAFLERLDGHTRLTERDDGPT